MVLGREFLGGRVRATSTYYSMFHRPPVYRSLPCYPGRPWSSIMGSEDSRQSPHRAFETQAELCRGGYGGSCRHEQPLLGSDARVDDIDQHGRISSGE